MIITDIIAIILSIAAIIVSISIAVMDVYYNKKNTAVSLEAEICFKIYYEYLTEKIPEGRDYITYSNNILSETDKLRNTLNDIRRDSNFFKYRDKQYYERLKNKLGELEDYLVEKEGEMEQDDFGSFCNKVNNDIAEIYQMIMKEYSGVSRR